MFRGRSGFFRAVVAAAVGAAVAGLALSPAGASDDPRLAEQWGLSVIGAPPAWAVADGGGTIIAVVDSGVDLLHPDLKDKLLPGRNFLDPTKSAQDDHGHGTHVAGTAAAATGNGIGVAGTAPGAAILPVKVLDAQGRGSAGDISGGIRWAADSGAHVVNLSLEPNAVVGALFGNGLEEAVRYAWSKGSIVVVAAGNSSLFSSSAQNVPAVVVTATTRDDQKAGYASAVGAAQWSMAAPGGAGSGGAEDILSTRPAGAYGFEAGTSMAAPHVAGAAALLRSMGMGPQQTVDRLLSTARDLGPAGRDSTFGAGRLDLACAAGRCGATTAGPGSSVATGPATADGTVATDPGGTPGAAAGQPASGGSGSAAGPGAAGSGSPAAARRSAATHSAGGVPGSGLSVPAAPTTTAPALSTAPPVAGPGDAAPGKSGDAEEAVAPGPGTREFSASAGGAALPGAAPRVLQGAAAGLLFLVAIAARRLRRRGGL